MSENINKDGETTTVLILYVLDKDTPLFDVSLPQGVTFKCLTEDIADIVDLKYLHRYPGSKEFFQLLIRNQNGYGLYKDDQLVSWGFVKEVSQLGHIYTLEEHRRKGYGRMIIKLICNEILKKKNDPISYVMEENVLSCDMHIKLGFKETVKVYKSSWVENTE